MRLAVPAVLLTAAVLAAPSGAQAASDACKEPLSTAGSTSPFTTTSGKRLGFGQLAVNTTTANPNRYCIRVKLGGRTVTHQRTSSTYARQANGTWKKIGQATGRVYKTKDYTQTLVVAANRRRNLSYGIKVGSTWYYAQLTRENA